MTKLINPMFTPTNRTIPKAIIDHQKTSRVDTSTSGYPERLKSEIHQMYQRIDSWIPTELTRSENRSYVELGAVVTSLLFVQNVVPVPVVLEPVVPLVSDVQVKTLAQVKRHRD